MHSSTFAPILLLLIGAEPLPVGADQTTTMVGEHQLDLFTYKPAGYRDGPLIVVFHGMLRNADDYRDNGRGLGDRHRAVIVAPRFDETRFPNTAYQQGGLFKEKEVLPSDQWTWSLVPPLVAAIRTREGRAEQPVYLIGHSAGGQFLARLAAFVTTPAQRIVIANPGTHLFPTRDLPYPYGFGGLPDKLSDDAMLRRYLARPLTIFLGTADTESEYLDTSEIAMKQGATRYERGQKCFQLGRDLAKAKGWEFGWRLVEAPSVGHDAKKMFNHPSAAEAFFGKGKP